MVVFIGASFIDDRVHTTAVDRKVSVIESASVPIRGLRRLGTDGVWEVPHGEWVRAGCLALQDLYYEIPVKQRKLWGIALSGPSGWVAIDPDLDPISPLRLTPGQSPIPDLTRWIEANPRRRAHIFQILSPKDYFRFRLSGGLATDVTQASLTGLLDLDNRLWDTDRVAALDLEQDWFPPAFQSASTTGRISQDGVDMTGIPGGIWFVAGADTVASREIASLDPRQGELLVRLEDGELELRLTIRAADPGRDGWKRLASALVDWHTLSKRVRPTAGEALDASFLEDTLRQATEDLAVLATKPSGVVIDSRKPLPEWIDRSIATSTGPARPGRFAGEDDPGCACLAGLARNIFRGTDTFFRRLDDSRTIATSPSPPADGPIG